jgi:methylated-DNA-[protein]-cysteine S-methyltransferase
MGFSQLISEEEPKMCVIATTSMQDTPVGLIGLAASSQGLTRLVFGPKAVECAGNGGPANGLLRTAEEQLREYFDGSRRTFDLPLDLRGTPFRLAVWQALLEIPFGRTVSYGDIARQIGKPTAVRAVGAANGANPIGLVVPCHRVVGSDGALTGYAGGLAAKRTLLSHEGVRLTGDRVDGHLVAGDDGAKPG